MKIVPQPEPTLFIPAPRLASSQAEAAAQDLPAEVVENIVSHLGPTDAVRAGAVCKLWLQSTVDVSQRQFDGEAHRCLERFRGRLEEILASRTATLRAPLPATTAATDAHAALAWAAGLGAFVLTMGVLSAAVLPWAYPAARHKDLAGSRGSDGLPGGTASPYVRTLFCVLYVLGGLLVGLPMGVTAAARVASRRRSLAAGSAGLGRLRPCHKDLPWLASAPRVLAAKLRPLEHRVQINEQIRGAVADHDKPILQALAETHYNFQVAPEQISLPAFALLRHPKSLPTLTAVGFKLNKHVFTEAARHAHPTQIAQLIAALPWRTRPAAAMTLPAHVFFALARMNAVRGLCLLLAYRRDARVLIEEACPHQRVSLQEAAARAGAREAFVAMGPYVSDRANRERLDVTFFLLAGANSQALQDIVVQ